MPLFEYQCHQCGGVSEVFVRAAERGAHAVRCLLCGSADTARAVSGFSFKSARPEKYNAAFREQVAPFLMSRPGAREFFADGSESTEAKVHALTEQIGERVDGLLQDQVFKKLQG